MEFNTKQKVKEIPFFSIIVTVYNKEKYIKECLESVINQTYKNYELIIVDDGSTDSSLDICKQFIHKPNVFLFCNTNHGLVWTREFGLKKAQGEYIMYLDADDYFYKNALEVCHKYLTIETNIEMLINVPIVNKNAIKVLNHNETFNYFKNNFFANSEWINLRHGTFCIAKSLLEKHYCKDYRITRGEDWAFSYECLFFSNRTVMVNFDFYNYRQVKNSMNKTNELDFRNIFLIINYWQEHIGVLNELINERITNVLFSYLWEYINNTLKYKSNIIKVICKKYSQDNVINYRLIRRNVYNYNHLPWTSKLLLLLLAWKKYRLLFFLCKLSNKIHVAFNVKPY